MVTDYFLPRSSGGVERAVFEVARNLVNEGHRVTVLTLRKRGEPKRELMAGIEVVRVPGWDLSGKIGAQVAFAPLAWPAIWRELSRNHYDAVHAHSLFFHVSLAAAVIARLKRVALVTTAHLGSPEELGWKVAFLTSAFERTFGRVILRSSDAVIAVSNAVGEHVARGMKHRERLHVIPNGVDLQTFAPLPEDPGRDESHGHEAVGPVRVLVVGRLIFNKGPQFVLQAAPKVLASYPNVRFVFVGDGPMEEELRAQATNLGIAANVEFLGHREDVAALLQTGSIMVRASLSEGLPLVALEAMACGLPVIATDVGGTREVVQDGVTGYLLRPGDVAGLTEAMCRLAGDAKSRAEMGANGRAFVEQGYDWRQIALRTAAVYRAVVG
jgi:glycosyltransferase involved in cell wall biosynthesis